MLIGLSWAELQAARHWGTPRHREYLTHHRSRTAKGAHYVAMPAAGWRSLADILVQEAFHPSGRHRKTRNAADGVSATRQAAVKIERALATTLMHPAMQNEATVGTSGEILVGWRQQKGYSLYPIPGVAPSFLCPYYAEMAGVGTVTMWRPQASPPILVPDLFPDPSHHDSW